MITFKTADEATAAGFVPCRGVHDRYRGFQMVARDVSGGNSYGYRFTLAAQTEPHMETDWQELMPLTRWRGGESVTVSLTDEKNAIGYFGAFSVRFNCATLEAARGAFRALVDAYYDGSRSARLEERTAAAALASADARQAVKRQQRARRLQDKYGDELSPQWAAVAGV